MDPIWLLTVLILVVVFASIGMFDGWVVWPQICCDSHPACGLSVDI